MNKENLLKFANYLESLDLPKFNIEHLSTCALPHVKTVFPEVKDETHLVQCIKVFEIQLPDVTLIFGSGGKFNNRRTELGLVEYDGTPTDKFNVIKNIKILIE